MKLNQRSLTIAGAVLLGAVFVLLITGNLNGFGVLALVLAFSILSSLGIGYATRNNGLLFVGIIAAFVFGYFVFTNMSLLAFGTLLGLMCAVVLLIYAVWS
jgi:hypothetical protein